MTSYTFRIVDYLRCFCSFLNFRAALPLGGAAVWYPSFCLAFFVPSPLLGSLHLSGNQLSL